MTIIELVPGIPFQLNIKNCIEGIPEADLCCRSGSNHSAAGSLRIQDQHCCNYSAEGSQIYKMEALKKQHNCVSFAADAKSQTITKCVRLSRKWAEQRQPLHLYP